MMAAKIDLAGMALVIAALGGLVTSIGGVYIAIKLAAVHHEVKTFNDKTLGQLGADQETRRALSITHDERTPTEQRHIDTAPPAESAQGPD